MTPTELHPFNLDRLMAALDDSRRLMANDPATFRRGYSLDNAVIAVQELHGLDADEVATVTRLLNRAAA